VIDMLNRYFVSVTTSNEDYNVGGGATQREKSLREIIAGQARRVAADPNIGGADVRGYILKPDGSVLSTNKLPYLSQTEDFLKWLGEATAELHTKPGPTLVKATGVEPPEIPDRGIRLHIATRYFVDNTTLAAHTDGGNVFENMILPRMRALSRVPTEDWVVLTKEECKSLLGPENAAIKDQWTLDRKIVENILINFRPSSTNNDPKERRIEDATLTATLQSADDGIGRVRLEGKLRIRCPFLNFRDDDHYIDALLFGYMDYDVKSRQIKSLRIVTDKGTWVGLNFGAALKSVP
jgi:hypothetical protein